MSDEKKMADRQKRIRKTAINVLYYGAAVDSVKKSLGRTKSTASKYYVASKNLLSMVKTDKPYDKATATDVENTMVNNAYKIVGSLIVILVFLVIVGLQFKSLTPTKIAIDCIVLAVFFYRLICHSIVYVYAKNELQQSLGADNAKN